MVYTLCARTSALACSEHARKHKELQNYKIKGKEKSGKEHKKEEARKEREGGKDKERGREVRMRKK
jgi:hypothetical protein